MIFSFDSLYVVSSVPECLQEFLFSFVFNRFSKICLYVDFCLAFILALFTESLGNVIGDLSSICKIFQAFMSLHTPVAYSHFSFWRSNFIYVKPFVIVLQVFRSSEFPPLLRFFFFPSVFMKIVKVCK